jgi:hypothetical protein
VSRRQLFVEPVQDDSVNIAGWVFADLLLSLSVIFLATISFAVPGVIGDAATPSNSVGQVLNIQDSKNQGKSPIEQGFNFYYSSFNKSQIESDLKAYFLRKNLSTNSGVLYAQIVGGFDDKTEGSEFGTMRALEFSIALKKAEVSAFEGANFDLTTSSALKPNQVALRLAFAPPISITK